MQAFQCKKCGLLINEHHKLWDFTIATRRCPKCHIAEADEAQFSTTEEPYLSVTAALEGWFTNSLAELPLEKLSLIATHHPHLLTLWGKLDVDRRLAFARQRDYLHDPATRVEREQHFDIFSRLEEQKRELRAIKTMKATSFDEREKEKRQENECRTNIKRIEGELAKLECGETTRMSTERISSIKAERDCETYLLNLMIVGTKPIYKKDEYRRDLPANIVVSARGFDRAWANAIKTTGNKNWLVPGRRKIPQ